jgi:hypothetical protein
MTKEELFAALKQLIDKLEDYKKTSIVTFKDVEEKQLLRTVYTEIYRGVQVDISCTKCVLNYLNIMLAYYEREYPKHVASLPVTPLSEITGPETSEPAEILTKEKRGRKKK